MHYEQNNREHEKIVRSCFRTRWIRGPSPEDQERLDKAWEDGAVADEDVPETARKPEKDGEDEDAAEKPKKKKAPAQKDQGKFLCLLFYSSGTISS